MSKKILFAASVVAFTLAALETSSMAQPPKGAKMECKLILSKDTAKIAENVPAEVELKNITKEDLVIEYSAHPFEYLDLRVVDPDGKKISNRAYGGAFSPFPTKQKLKLGAGECYRFTVRIDANSNQSDWTKPGVYKITAVYGYKKETITSKEMTLTLTPK